MSYGHGGLQHLNGFACATCLHFLTFLTRFVLGSFSVHDIPPMETDGERELSACMHDTGKFPEHSINIPVPRLAQISNISRNIPPSPQQRQSPTPGPRDDQTTTAASYHLLSYDPGGRDAMQCNAAHCTVISTGATCAQRGVLRYGNSR